ncbi:MAG TPA: LLM class flavin-dependent oxidoreductase [Candidatus Margulisiibacteriota bacterium]|nr:LLM class flavin-dependent oxidoreductase [Candidatus Margulisiibacteriota bacterium]
MTHKPAISLAAMAGRRQATLEVAQEIERQGFSGIYCASFGDGMGLCEALALCTKEIAFGTAIANIYTRHPFDYAQTATLIHELSRGRFRFGIGISHAPTNSRLGLKTGKPLADVRSFVEQLRKGAQRWGDLPPIVLATLRKKMVQLAAEIGQGAVWANAARSHMPTSLSFLGNRVGDAFVGNMIPTCISDDRAAAAAVNRKTLTGYVMLPNYQNYWIEAGYEEDMRAIRRAIADGQPEKIPSLMSDTWLADCTLFGSVQEVRDGVEAWYAAGVKTPILVPSSTSGGQMKAIEELLAAFK